MSSPLDPDLASVQEARDLAIQARTAQRAFASASQADVDRICAAMVDAIMARSAELAQQAHDETGYGVPAHKKVKIEHAAAAVWESVKDVPTVGVVSRDEQRQVVEIASPVGVVVGLTPSTNPNSTAIFKVLISVKARNGVVIAPHPSARESTAAAVRLMAEAGERAGMPPGLVSCLTRVTLPGTQELMTHYATDLILATGGTPMVKAAHSTGKPAIGVGPGNVPVYVDRSADVPAAAHAIVNSKSFDCSVICATEQSVVADAAIAVQLRQEMARLGARWVSRDEQAALAKVLFTPNGAMDARSVGKTPQQLGALAGIEVAPEARILVADLEAVGPSVPLSGEKLTTVLGFYEVDGWKEGCDRSLELLRYGGDGHSLVIHARDEDVVMAFGLEKPAFRILVNTWGTLGAVGATTGLAPSMTLAPGGVGGSIVSDNITVRHVLNTKRVAWGVTAPPAAAVSTDGPARAAAAEPAPAVDDRVERIVRRVLAELGAR